MRYKEFNPNRVLEDCISLFWDGGFGGCSIKDIVDKTNVNRYSLYEEFESKEGILHASLQLYKERYANKHQELLAADKSLELVLRDFYVSFLSDNNSHPPGDYILSIATELADSNSEVKNTLDTYLKELQQKLEKLLEKHNHTEKESAFLAKHLIALYCTSNCFCVIHSYQKRISIVDNGLKMLLSKTNVHA